MLLITNPDPTTIKQHINCVTSLKVTPKSIASSSAPSKINKKDVDKTTLMK